MQNEPKRDLVPITVEAVLQVPGFAVQDLVQVRCWFSKLFENAGVLVEFMELVDRETLELIDR